MIKLEGCPGIFLPGGGSMCVAQEIREIPQSG